MKQMIAAAAVAVLLAGPALAGNDSRLPSPENAAVRIIAPADGATVASPVTVVFGLTGMGVAPAGVDKPNTGHHHLLVNRELPTFDAPVPADETSLHYGGGQTETTLELPAGTHTLQLLLGDWRHVPHDPAVYSDVVTITVE
ncbi:MAG: DUF4399 domain-containing protein [Pseudomonadota bacterium]